jgi:hypothetical protein
MEVNRSNYISPKGGNKMSGFSTRGLDEEWVELIEQALKFGISPEEIRDFFERGTYINNTK